MLLGEYEHTIDEKNRLTLPAKFRRAFVDGIVLTRGVEGHLDAYTREGWDDFVTTQLAQFPRFSKEARQLSRHIYAGAAEADLDRQGRVMLPTRLMAYAKLGREVVVAGVGDRLEIWDRDAWREELTAVEGGVQAAAERLAERN